MAITEGDTGSTVAADSTAATLTGAGTIVTGINQDLCRAGCVRRQSGQTTARGVQRLAWSASVLISRNPACFSC